MDERPRTPPLLLFTLRDGLRNSVSAGLLRRIQMVLPEKIKRMSLNPRKIAEQHYHTYTDLEILRSDIKAIGRDNAVLLYDYPSSAERRQFRIVRHGHDGAKAPVWAPRVYWGVQVTAQCDLENAAHQLLSVFLLHFDRQCLARKRSYPRRLTRQDAMENLFPLSAGDHVAPGW